MYYFNCDYCEGAHPQILARLSETNLEQTAGYGNDPYCAAAAEKIRAFCRAPEADVHFLVGGTQANMTVIAAALRPHQGVLCAASGHINVHESGAVEATGHKVLSLPSCGGKVRAADVEDYCRQHGADPDREHTVQPKMVYISQPTEFGTLYTAAELKDLSAVCRRFGLLLFADGARLGYGLCAPDNDVTAADLARLCDVFYIGGTKLGALFGEAVVIANPALKEDFRYMIKQRGGMLAKGRLLGLQFDTLFTDGLYLRGAEHAVRLAERIRETLDGLRIPLLVENRTNQIFAVLENGVYDRLRDKYVFSLWEKPDDSHSAVRICTSWATDPAAVEALCRDLTEVCGG